LVLENIEFGGCGNDFAIDDIGLYFEGTPPEIATPEDLIGCDDDEDGFATYDLTAQNEDILNGLDAADFNITFHTTDADAMNDENAFVDPTMYTNTSDPEVIWVRVEREDQDSCFSITQFNIEIGPNLNLGITLPALFEICSNEEFPAIDGTVTNAAIDLTLVTYEWKDASGGVVSTDPIFVPTAAGVYTLEVFAPVCGINVFTTEVIVFDAPVLDLGMDESFCEGDDAFEIVPNITGDTTGITYLWSTGETTPTITVDSTGVYTLTILVDVCTVEATVSVAFLANPIITLGADFQTCPDMDTTLTAAVDVEGDLVYEWLDPNGAVIADESGPSIVIQLPAGTIGSALYTVNVLNGNCLGSDTIDISLYNVDNCIISEGISPNGDGMNDTLDLQFLDDRSGIELFQVFNRLGTAIYQNIDYVNEWGGQTNDGEALPTGTYFYVIQLENDDAVYGREVSGWVYVNRED
jgi:gliding motility-associated-like protein